MSEWAVYDLDAQLPGASIDWEIVMGVPTAEEAAKEFALDELTDDGSSDEPRSEIRVAVRRVSDTRWRHFRCRVWLEPRASAEEISKS